MKDTLIIISGLLGMIVLAVIGFTLVILLYMIPISILALIFYMGCLIVKQVFL